MSIPSGDLLMALFFLAALLLVAGSRKRLSAANGQSYRLVTLGLGVLTFMAVFRIHVSGGTLQDVPFLNDPIFSRLIFWIGNIAGVTLLAGGVSRWLSSRTSRKPDHVHLRGLEFIRRLGQLTAVEKRIPVVLSKTADYLVDDFGLQSVAVFVRTWRRPGLRFLTAKGDIRIPPATLRAAVLDETPLRSTGEDRLTPTPTTGCPAATGALRPDQVLPVEAGDDVPVVFLLWQRKNGHLHADDRRNFRIAAEVIGRAIELRRSRQRTQSRRKRETWLRGFRSQAGSERSFRENVSSLVAWLRQMVPCRFVSLTVSFDKTDTRAYFIGDNGAVLMQKRADTLARRLFIDYVAQNAYPVVIDDISAKTAVPVDRSLVEWGIRSVAAVPLNASGSRPSVLVLGSQSVQRFKHDDVTALREATPIATELLAVELGRRRAATAVQRLNVVTDFLADCVDGAALHDLFEKAVALLSAVMRTSLVRISTFDYGGASLKSRADVSLRPSDVSGSGTRSMPLSRMPYHRLVRDSGKTLLIGQGGTNREMSAEEAMLLGCRYLQSGLLVPIAVGRQVLAVISLAEMRRPERYRYDQMDIDTCEGLASVLSGAIQLALDGRTSRQPRSRAEAVAPVQAGEVMLGSRVRSSLSSILGSVELIKSRYPDSAVGLERYLSIIDRSAHRIKDLFVKEGTPQR